MSTLTDLGKRLDNINTLIKSEYPQDSWVLEQVVPLFVKAISTGITIDRESTIVERVNKVIDTYEYRYNAKLQEGMISKAITGAALAAALFAGNPAQAQNPIVGKVSNFLKKLTPTAKVDTIKVKVDAPLQLAKFKDYKGAGYGFAESKDQAGAMKMARFNATKDLLNKMGQQKITAGIEEKDTKMYQLPDGTYQCEVLVVVGNIY
jgi:hypothetical protein